MITIEDELEIKALGKLLNFIKYDCSDPDCLLFAASPLINNIYANLLKELGSIYTRAGRPSIENKHYIESYPIYLENIKSNILRTPAWSNLSEEIKEKYVQELIHPYKFRNETVFSLLRIGNENNI
jgi:hypothetical protein